MTRLCSRTTDIKADRHITRQFATICLLWFSGLSGLASMTLPESADAWASGPQWTITAVSRPTNFAPGDGSGEDAYVISVTNTGGAATDGSPITIGDELPDGLSAADGASGEDRLPAIHNLPSAVRFTCGPRGCVYTGVVIPDDTLIVRVPVDVSASTKPLVTNIARVSGGGASDAAMSTPTSISSTPAAFGISPGGASTVLSTNQAGAHPDLTTSIAFNTINAKGSLAGDPKDTRADEPPGFAGDLVDSPSCPSAQFLQGQCPTDTQVGIIFATLLGHEIGHAAVETEPVYNLEPDQGNVAKLGFNVSKDFFFEGDVTLRSDYRLEVTFANANAINEIDNVSLTVWGVPADPVHDPFRWSNKLGGNFGSTTEATPADFLTSPTACSTGSIAASFTVNSWQQPDKYVSENMPFGPIVGCDRLTMQPALTVQATTDRAYAPTGLDLRMAVPQTYNNSEGLATSTLKRAVVRLPEGMTVNPSAGAGLGACAEAQFEQEQANVKPGLGCPHESKIGEVDIVTPTIKEKISGNVFLAQPYANPFGSLLALYIVARLPDRGIIVRSAGEVSADLVTGQLVTTFDDLPDLPFSGFTFKFHSGQTSPLVTPTVCGEYVAQAELTPWAGADFPPLDPSIAPLPITHGFDGGSCPSGGAAPFSPQIQAGTLNNLAGSYSTVKIRVVRGDGEQEITRFSARLPAGLTANLTNVPFCPDADIQMARERSGTEEELVPSCPSASQIGRTEVGAGVGSVLAQAPGKIYMAGPYHGAPFSIVAITTAKVGPFDLGTVVVRQALAIDPTTAAVTVDASASDPIPHIIKGIVVHVRDIRAYIDRPSFTLNPTNCGRMNFDVTVSGSGANFASAADDQAVTVSDPFQAADCQSLAFKPVFNVKVSGKTSRRAGATLTVKLTYPKARQGMQANIRSVKVDLPKQLPSRLSTLQMACPDSTFEANPADCPAASRVGRAKATTPILPVSLAGPAYFVSHGGAKFPELVIVLQGYGVTLDLRGETFISKLGITSSTFRTVPDAPIGSFELVLPQGPNSALAANGNLCRDRLVMPIAFAAQNGLRVRQASPIKVTGCVKPAHRLTKHLHRRKRGVRSGE